MWTPRVDAPSGRSGDGIDLTPFCPRALKRGAVYAVGLETAAARVSLLVAPARAALSAGRPCALVTPLSPEQFAGLLCRAINGTDVAAAIKDGRVKLFTAVGDYAMNLFMRGAAGYVQELDHFNLEDGTLVVVDQADDLFTPHDHAAVVNQARTYHEWCERNRHTMLQLHLRTSPARPILDGNQAAAQYFAGVARVTSEAEGLCMTTDFWHSANGYSTGTVMRLDSLVRSSRSGWPRRMADASSTHSAEGQSIAGRRYPVWYLGPEDASLDQLSDQIRWRLARTFDEILRRGGRKKGTGVLISLDGTFRLSGTAAFRDLLDRVTDLRSVLGKEARIVVRESGYRLREHPQRRLLLLAGVDSFLQSSEPLSVLPGLFAAPRPAARDEPLAQADMLRDLVTGSDRSPDAGWLPMPAFVHEVRESLRRHGPLGVPCALAEVHLDNPSTPAPGKRVAHSTRPGDLSTSGDNSQLFFLRGCRGPEVFSVITRWIERAGAGSLHRLNLVTGESAIAERLEELREGDKGTSAVDVAQGKVASNILALPGAARAASAYGQVGMAAIAAVALCLTLLPGESLAGEKAPQGAGAMAAASAVTATRAYEEGRYGEAARLGLIELQQRGSDHDLRFRVANSLAWTGQYREAIRQYEALEASPLANEAALGVGNVYLWSGRPELADPLFRRVLKAKPDNAEARQSLDAAGRHLRPRTLLKPGWIDDSSNTERSSMSLAHRWRDASLRQVFELGAEAGKERRSADIAALNQRELSFSYEHLGLALMPKVEVAVQESPTSKVFGNAAIRLAEGAATIDVGRVNWGKLVFDPRALRDGLTANRAGLAVQVDSSIGGWQGSFAHFAVSDGNRVQDLNARYTPSWQPFPAGSGVRAFVGVYGRKADRREVRYWSPESGFYTGYLGVALDGSGADWDAYGELRRSQRLGGEGANGWSGGFGGTRWLNRDWAIRANAYLLETRRDQSAYRSKSVMFSIERLW